MRSSLLALVALCGWRGLPAQRLADKETLNVANKSVEFVNILREDLRRNNDDYLVLADSTIPSASSAPPILIPSQPSPLPNQITPLSNQPGSLLNQLGPRSDQSSLVAYQPGPLPNQPGLLPNQPGPLPNQLGLLPNQPGTHSDQSRPLAYQLEPLPNQPGSIPNQPLSISIQPGSIPNQPESIPNELGPLPNQAGLLPNQPGPLANQPWSLLNQTESQSPKQRELLSNQPELLSNQSGASFNQLKPLPRQPELLPNQPDLLPSQARLLPDQSAVLLDQPVPLRPEFSSVPRAPSHKLHVDTRRDFEMSEQLPAADHVNVLWSLPRSTRRHLRSNKLKRLLKEAWPQNTSLSLPTATSPQSAPQPAVGIPRTVAGLSPAAPRRPRRQRRRQVLRVVPARPPETRQKTRTSPSPDELDMAPARGGAIAEIRFKGRLCQRNLLNLEGPAYDRAGQLVNEPHAPRNARGRRFYQTRAPRLVLPRCCNCCKKSVLGCQ